VSLIVSAVERATGSWSANRSWTASSIRIPPSHAVMSGISATCAVIATQANAPISR
jgi:hypothetical protein